MSKHFEAPTQVVFTFHNGECYERCAGIAYHDEIICACCGGTFDMTDEFNEIEIEQELPWVSLIEEIAPDEPYGEIEDTYESHNESEEEEEEEE